MNSCRQLGAFFIYRLLIESEIRWLSTASHEARPPTTAGRTTSSCAVIRTASRPVVVDALNTGVTSRRYPAPRIVFRYVGVVRLGSIFRRILRMQASTLRGV